MPIFHSTVLFLLRPLGVMLLILPLLGGCASVPDGGDPRDPLEPFNRAIYRFNDAADRHVIKPVAEGYRDHVPQPIRTGVSNFFGNLQDVIILLNDLLQLKFEQGASDLARIIVNTTLGVAGFFDVATHLDLPKHDEDFGQTLGYWGVPDGPYLVLPILGPSSLRDAPSLYVDYRTSPQTYAVHRQWLSNTLWALNFTSVRAELLGVSAVLDDVAFDRYESLRDAWFERRAFQVSDGASAKSQDEELMDELDQLD